MQARAITLALRTRFANRQIQLTLILMMSVILWIAGAAIWLNQRHSGPAVKLLSKTELFVGKVAAGQTVCGDLLIGNQGDCRIILNRNPSGCACESDSNVDPFIIAPLNVGRLHVNVTSPQASGPFTAHVSYQTNDPRLPVIPITLYGQVLPCKS